jgi:hypothetical protein
MNQLFWNCGCIFERIVGQASQIKAKSAGPTCGVTFKWLALNDGLKPNQVARKLCQHVAVGRILLQGHHDLGVATDKGWVGTLPLQPTLFVLANNVGIVACPVVARETMRWISTPQRQGPTMGPKPSYRISAPEQGGG